MICSLKAGASWSLNAFGLSARLQDCQCKWPWKNVLTIADGIYRVFCAKSIYVHLVKSGREVPTPLLDLYFIPDALGSPHSKWPLGSSALCESIQFLLNQAYGKSSSHRYIGWSAYHTESIPMFPKTNLITMSHHLMQSRISADFATRHSECSRNSLTTPWGTIWENLLSGWDFGRCPW